MTMKQRLNEIYMRHTGRTLPEVEARMERDTFMSASQAVEFGLIDQVVEKREVGAKELVAAR